MLKDLGSLKFLLGFEVACNSSSISLPQRHKTLQLLEDTRLLGAKPMDFPMVPSFKLSKDVGDPLPNPTMYRRLVGCLLYLTNTSQFFSDPCTCHLKVVYHLLAYLKQSPSLGLFFSFYLFVLETC